MAAALSSLGMGHWRAVSASSVHDSFGRETDIRLATVLTHSSHRLCGPVATQQTGAVRAENW
jgi:hypothetical protein